MYNIHPNKCPRESCHPSDVPMSSCAIYEQVAETEETEETEDSCASDALGYTCDLKDRIPWISNRCKVYAICVSRWRGIRSIG